jgi:hypothetical protein
MGTASFPADPVTAGATAIQSTTFANVAADYTAVTFEQAKAYLSGKPGIRFFPAKLAPGWSFYLRNDLSGSSANLRNLVGIYVQTFSANHNAFSVGNGSYIVPIQDVYIHVLNWYPIQRTLSDSSIITRFKMTEAGITLSVDPETQGVYTDVGETRALEEAVGMILLRAAASAPVLTPALKALGGLHPLA